MAEYGLEDVANQRIAQTNTVAESPNAQHVRELNGRYPKDSIPRRFMKRVFPFLAGRRIQTTAVNTEDLAQVREAFTGITHDELPDVARAGLKQIAKESKKYRT